ncbi:cAMP-binding domain of CRP or a regulatory subunit of cAMP-dependent protein kinases [Roseomonas rosea]|uniref:cAMP-binding domain of CRP or a regulatory subunit of cAMP-dependent protein kinases n=1 Tax=Muricoccus roseus TaxID=198092 RepID=A0A1M6NAX2_9PROT|nr:helix-turn-helix domain-containing protein [Roseomonas rosea]SHJ92845.1 cAMP-binding domain of CRP or a regulatory subunit of cAMP-dependent protein kinases [Roseomonas rosea]
MGSSILRTLSAHSGFSFPVALAGLAILRLRPHPGGTAIRTVSGPDEHRAAPTARLGRLGRDWHRITKAPKPASLPRPRLVLRPLPAPGTDQPAERAEADNQAVSFGPEAEIYRQGSPVHHWYEVVSGAVRAVLHGADGRRQIVSFHFPGDLFGFDDVAGVHGLTVEAAAEHETVVLRHGRARLDALAAGDPSVASWLGVLNQQRLGHAHGHLMLLGRKSSAERLASFLLEMRARLPPSPVETPTSYSLPMDRTDIADYLGITLETVCRTLQSLRRSGVIELCGHRRVRILDLRQLMRLSGDPAAEAPAAVSVELARTGHVPQAATHERAAGHRSASSVPRPPAARTRESRPTLPRAQLGGVVGFRIR